jgi:hypothetical protein
MENKIINKEFIFVNRDSMDTCAKYVKLSNDESMVDIQVLYRYGKPSYYSQSYNDFISDRKANNSKFNWLKGV